MKIYLPQSERRRLAASVADNRSLRARNVAMAHDLAVARQEAANALAECRELRSMLGAEIDGAITRCVEGGR